MMRTVLAALALLPAAVISPLVGQGDNEDSRRTLAGLRGVYVVVSDMKEDARQKGLWEAQLRTDVELKLRQAGINVLTKEEVRRTPGLPHLDVTTSTLQLQESALSGLYAFAINVELVQAVCLGRSPSVLTLGRTWNATGVFGTVGSDNLGEYVRKDVRDVTDQFINAYLAANPKR
jgi:hypothetical protein